MVYKTTISGIDNLNRIFQVFVDASTKTDDAYTYILIPRTSDNSFKIADYYYFTKNYNIKFYQSTEINSEYEDTEFENNEYVDIEFETEEEALYFKMKYNL